jgi:hypothetical protein
MTMEIIKRTKTHDGKAVLVLASGDVTDQIGYTWTRHRTLDVQTALLVAEEAFLFDAAEMPSLMVAASRLAKRSPRGVLPGDPRALASKLSHKAGTRPADIPAPVAPALKPYRDPERCTGPALLRHVKHGCRRLFCPVCG